MFSYELCELSKNTFFINNSGRLLLEEDFVLIILLCNRKCGITAKLNIYYHFAIRSRRRKRQKKVADGVSGFDIYLLIEQLAVPPQIKIICLC